MFNFFDQNQMGAALRRNASTGAGQQNPDWGQQNEEEAGGQSSGWGNTRSEGQRPWMDGGGAQGYDSSGINPGGGRGPGLLPPNGPGMGGGPPGITNFVDRPNPVWGSQTSDGPQTGGFNYQQPLGGFGSQGQPWMNSPMTGRGMGNLPPNGPGNGMSNLETNGGYQIAEEHPNQAWMPLGPPNWRRNPMGMGGRLFQQSAPTQDNSMPEFNSRFPENNLRDY